MRLQGHRRLVFLLKGGSVLFHPLAHFDLDRVLVAQRVSHRLQVVHAPLDEALVLGQRRVQERALHRRYLLHR